MKRFHLIFGITVAPVMFTIAFFYEPHLEDLHTPLSLAGTIMIAVGTLLHLFSGLGTRGENV